MIFSELIILNFFYRYNIKKWTHPFNLFSYDLNINSNDIAILVHNNFLSWSLLSFPVIAHNYESVATSLLAVVNCFGSYCSTIQLISDNLRPL